MQDDVFESSDPEALAELMKVGTGRSEIWRPGERGDLLSSLLSAPLMADLGGDDPRTRRRAEAMLAEAEGSIATLRDLLQSPRPPRELLGLAAEHFAAAMASQAAPLPAEVARVIHASLLATAVVHYGQAHIGVDCDALCGEARWALSQAWIVDPVRQPCQQAVRILEE